MTRFNARSVGSSSLGKTKNLAGGNAYGQSSRLEFISITLTSFLKDQFYRSADDTVTRLRELIAKEDPKFAAKTAIYARTKYGMRSVSHLIASELARPISGQEWAKNFYEKIVYRPDDMTEIVAAYCGTYGKPLPNAIKKGFARVLEGLDEYKLAKYRMEGKDVSIVDIVNLVHPKATPALTKLVKGELKNKDTWEAQLSEAGQDDENAEEAKTNAWKTLLESRKLGYFALLRNLRNIVDQAPDCIGMACEQLTDEKAIARSLVLPFRFSTAYKELSKMDGGMPLRTVLVALSKAVDLSLGNLPKFNGKTLIVVDVSGSMMSVMDKAALFAAAMYKGCDADLMLFDTDARYATLMPTDSTLTLADKIESLATGGGTNFQSIFPTANKAYDRVIILSDMQGWMESGYVSMPNLLRQYSARTGANPYIFSFDLAGYGTLQLPQDRVYCLAGFSEKTLSLMQFLEEDKTALEREINAINL